MPPARAGETAQVDWQRVAKATAALERAQRAVDKARRDLALATPTGAPGILHDPRFAAAERALARHSGRLLRTAGVVGAGVGCPRVDGKRDQSTESVSVFVSRKLSRAALSRRAVPMIPATLLDGKGHKVRTDVIEAGRLVRQWYPGGGLGPGRIRKLGSLGTYALDSATGQLLALSAMHITGRSQVPAGADLSAVSPPAGEVGSRRFGAASRGMLSGVDAVAFRPELAVPDPYSLGRYGRIRGWRPVNNPQDDDLPVMMFGHVSGVQFGRIAEPNLPLPADDLIGTFGVSIHSQLGDSGAALIDGSGYVLGLLVGMVPKSGIRIFSSIGTILSALNCYIPTQ